MQLSEKQGHKHGSVTFYAACCKGSGEEEGTDFFKPLLFQLQDVVIPFEPGVFGGDGTETRKSICFANVASDTLQQIAAWEESIGATSSNVKKNDLLRCKVNVDRARVWDASGNPATAPETWRNWRVCAQIQVRGKWETRQGSGLSLEVTDLLFKSRQASPQFVSPFGPQ